MSKVLIAACLVSAILCAPATGQTQQPPADTAQAGAPNPALRPDATKQMEQDLNTLDSMLNNMAAETSFVKDTNLQILLNTNYRMWSILLRDLRLQVEQQKRAADEARAKGATR